MAINQNHLFEDLNGVKCAIVEKNAALERVEFLRRILEYNRYTVVVAPSPPPKTPPAAAAAPPATAAPSASVPPGEPGPVDTTASAPLPVTFTVGVTDVMFNPVNAIFGRLLKTPEGHIVSLAFWQEQENEGDNERPYFDK